MIRIFAFCFALCCPVLAQTGQAPIVGDPPNNVSLPNIIQSFAATEKEYKQARDQYAYTQEVTVRASCRGAQSMGRRYVHSGLMLYTFRTSR